MDTYDLHSASRIQRYGRWQSGLTLVLGIILGSSGPAGASYEAGMYAFMTGSYQEALENFLPMIDQRHSPSQTALGLMYLNGLGVEHDPVAATFLFIQAASSGNPAAANYLGLIYQGGATGRRDLEMATRWYRQSAEDGYAEGQLNFGSILEARSPPDYQGAAEWYGRAADRGLGGALYRLALLYENGTGVGRDAVEAAVLLEKASARGNAQARTALGMKYMTGNGVPANPVVAHMYLTLGASLGDESGEAALRKIELELSPERLAEAQRMARNWRPFY